MDAQQFDIVVEKTDKGFGIYFAKVARIDSGVDLLAVDGFVEDPTSPVGKGQNREALGCLQLGDILTKVNGEACEGKEVADIISLLRSADSGQNTLSFSRNMLIYATLKDEVSTKTDNEEAIDLVDSVTTPKSGFMGALLKVKSKIRAEIDGDEEELLREQLEDERFEKQWLEEVRRAQKAKEYLEQEYPTLMDAWKDGRAPSSSSRVIPEWPAVKKAYDSTVNYDPVDSSELVASSSTGSGANTRSIHCSQSLQSTLECLRVGFMWRSDDLRAFSRRLELLGFRPARDFSRHWMPAAATSSAISSSGKDALIVLLDVRKAMFSPYPHATAEAPSTWFHAVVELVIKLLKLKVVANDNSLLSVVFFGTVSGLFVGHNYLPSALLTFLFNILNILQALLETDIQSEFESMQNSEKLSFSNALWQCGISFSNANLKKKDSQRIWIFTNDDSPEGPDADEVGRIQKQVQNHTELKRTLNLFYIAPPGKENFDLAKFYGCSFKDFSAEEDEEMVDNEASFQPAFPVSSLDDLMDGSLRKRFRKRRLTTFPLHITKGVSIGVELYALVVVQRKNTPVALDASTNTPLKTETKWLCEDTGAYLTPDQIKKYIDYGGKRVYFTRDDVVEIKHYDAPGLQLICFKPLNSLKWNDNIRSPYFVYPCDGYIEGSSTAFMAIQNSMFRKQKFALARLIARKTSEPRLVALVPQEEENDEMGQVQPSGFNVIFLPYLDDIRDIPVEAVTNVDQEKIDAAKHLISKLKLTEAPSFENPALALDEEALEFDEKKDTTLPDADGFGQDEVKVRRMKRGLVGLCWLIAMNDAVVQDAITNFRDVCGGDLIDVSTTAKRKVSCSWVTLGGLVGSSATGGLPYSMDTPAMDGNVAAGGAAGESVMFEGLPDFVCIRQKQARFIAHRVHLQVAAAAGQLTQNALRRIKTLRHPNILAYLDGTEVPNNGPVVIVTEHVMPLSEFLTALRMEYGANSEEFTMCVSWGLRPSYSVDIWAFGCLMYYVFNDGQFRSSDVSTAANIPPAIRTQFRKAIDDNAARRPSPQKMLGCSYFDTPFIKRMDFLENLAVKDSDEKVAFYKELCANLETLPRCFGVHKILPALKQVVEFGAATGAKNGPVKLDPSASHMLRPWSRLAALCLLKILRQKCFRSSSSYLVAVIKVMDEAAQMKIREELDAKERELKRVSGEGGHVGDVGTGATPPPSNNGHSSGGKNENNGFSSSSAPSSKHNSFNAFPADELAAEDGWGNDDDLDGLDSPKRTSLGFGSSLSVNRGTSSSFTSPAASSLSASLSSSSSSVKLSVSRNTGTNLASSTAHTNKTTPSFAINTDTAWGDDNWGGDDDLDFDASVPKVKALSVGSQKSISGLNASTMTSASAPGSSGGLSTQRKTASERRAEAQAKTKAKHEPLGAMKLDSTANTKTDDWNWDF
ncbi:Ku70, bridge and pillars domain [Phytophthora cactorum]|nr:Ku70, bridge and pillars domain [Phytophthora cactorum]